MLVPLGASSSAIAGRISVRALAGAAARIGAWRRKIRLNATTRAYFELLAP